MKNAIMKLTAVFAAICLIFPLTMMRADAYEYEIDVTGQQNLSDVIQDAAGQTTETQTLYIIGDNTDYNEAISLSLNGSINIVWLANMPNAQLEITYFPLTSPQNFHGSFSMNGGSLGSIDVNGDAAGNFPVSVNGGQVFGQLTGPISDNRRPAAPPEPVSEESEPESAPTPPPEPGTEVDLTGTLAGIKPGSDEGEPTVKVVDNTPITVNDQQYYGTVDIVRLKGDKPLPIPDEVFINGVRYYVGDTVYIVGDEEKIAAGYAETGFTYVFTAVENSDEPVKFTAEGLPDGLEMTEDGVITTKIIPAPVGKFTVKVTADNGLDTNVFELTIEIKEGSLSDEELYSTLTVNNDPDLEPVVLDENGEPQESGGITNIWINEDLTLHYDPDIEDFYGLFLDGKLLTKDRDYLLRDGSTVVVLTEQTMVPLTNGDHVVTGVFEKNSKVGMDTVINDVGSSSFVFRFGEKGSAGVRLNIGGDGVKGSVTYEGGDEKEQPLTTITANSEAIKERAKNLSNATGNEIIAAFETKQSGGFGGKTATFAVSVKSLGLDLKNGTEVYIAVYDSKTEKTYQNAGTVKDGMIVFKTKHSGVFMVALERF
ncbi:MAG: hypothetical protein LBL87_02655 [Ruminococcus sp.]|nr:hypothetical protein [Ruminococcus sp.]